MIYVDDIDKILARLGYDGEAIRAWCRRNDVDEHVMRHLADVYGFTRETQTMALDAFRLGHEARRGDEARSESRAGDGPRYAVELVVVDRSDGRIVGNPTPARYEAEGLAATFNAIEAQPSRTGREA